MVARALAVPLPFLAGLVFSRHWSAYSGAAWPASSFILGPALAFFELTSGGWSAGRLAYGPALLLSLSIALVKPGDERAATHIR